MPGPLNELTTPLVILTPADAYKTFMTSGSELLVCENFIIKKKNN